MQGLRGTSRSVAAYHAQIPRAKVVSADNPTSALYDGGGLVAVVDLDGLLEVVRDADGVKEEHGARAVEHAPRDVVDDALRLR
eukprot:3933100-Rhodomonas_salina.2